ncbi:BMP family lipoprotein [Crassaminicella indica]|uniref:BMP family ABC transporter substrate-binding protein n=1 Tax=Crassaminicella indica TaxID=2855394 RepID=A0ABX8R9H1_9CLOT|nr:BMP family ABC transporter substrate-binding protein [Crassaminicella indica]QXM05684.1 BMP family ABC transporter substrate-binding protein [Crassaminicella indica]
MFKKGLAILLTVILVAGLLAGCGQKTPEQAEKTKLKIAMVTDVGGVNDQSFNQSAWEGLKRAEDELGIKVSYKESRQDADYGPNMESLLDEENDLIWGIGYKMGNLVKEEAEKNPEQKYAIVDYAYEKTPENLVGVVFKAEQSSFLVGYIAGKMTKTGKVGFVGGVKGNVIDGFEYGYRAGVKKANKDVKVLVQYADSFTDAAKGKAIANQMYKDGADIVFHAAGGVGDGIIEAAKEQNKFAIGVDRDQSNLAPENVLTSAMKHVDTAVFDIAKSLKEGKFPGGTTVVYGLKEGGVDIAPTSNKHVPADILKEVEDLKQQIIDGKIVVPYNEKTFSEFK